MDKSRVIEFYSEDLELDRDTLASWSSREFCDAKIESLTFYWKAAIWAGQMPRRIGGDATARQLSADKKLMRMLAHLFSQLNAGWGRLIGETLPVDLGSIGPAEKRFGAQIDAEEFLRELVFVSTSQRSSVCTIAVQMDAPKIAMKMLPLFSRELTNLDRISNKFHDLTT